MLNIEVGEKTSLRDELMESASFRRNPVRWSLFYASAASSVFMFVILCTLSIWSIHIGSEVRETLNGVNEIVPEVKESLQMLQFICSHENFTKRYGSCPWNL